MIDQNAEQSKNRFFSGEAQSRDRDHPPMYVHGSNRRQNLARRFQMRKVDHLAVHPERAHARIGIKIEGLDIVGQWDEPEPGSSRDAEHRAHGKHNL